MLLGDILILLLNLKWESEHTNGIIPMSSLELHSTDITQSVVIEIHGPQGGRNIKNQGAAS